jgi:hypothetical protein
MLGAGVARDGAVTKAVIIGGIGDSIRDGKGYGGLYRIVNSIST